MGGNKAIQQRTKPGRWLLFYVTETEAVEKDQREVIR
jgi:hypothetical protein